MVNIRNTDLTSLSKSQLITIIYGLVDEIDLLKTRIIDLEEKLSEKGKPTNQKKRDSFMGKIKRKNKSKS